MTSFDYSTAFARNIGWVAPHEQEILRWKRVAIAGLGGVGGSHFVTLTRLGIGAFNIADAHVEKDRGRHDLGFHACGAREN